MLYLLGIILFLLLLAVLVFVVAMSIGVGLIGGALVGYFWAVAHYLQAVREVQNKFMKIVLWISVIVIAIIPVAAIIIGVVVAMFM